MVGEKGREERSILTDYRGRVEGWRVVEPKSQSLVGGSDTPSAYSPTLRFCFHLLPPSTLYYQRHSIPKIFSILFYAYSIPSQFRCCEYTVERTSSRVENCPALWTVSGDEPFV